MRKNPLVASKRPVPKSPGKFVDRETAARMRRLAAEGRADIELIKRRRQSIAEDFYEIGEALVRLKRPGVREALRYDSFGAMCNTELGFSNSKADKLVAIASRVTRGDAMRFGQERTVALLQLADATPDDNTLADLNRAVLKLPSGREFIVAKESATAIKKAARQIRDARPAPLHGRGRTSTPEERAEAARLETVLQRAGFGDARVRAVATLPGRGSNLRIDGVPIAEFARFRRALSTK